MKQNSPYFSIERDKTYPFFCEACIVGKPETEISQDNRYCHGCYDILLKEAEMDTGRHTVDWKPRESFPKYEIEPLRVAQVSQGVRTIMSTLEKEENEVDIIQPPTQLKTAIRADSKRGPRFGQLPEQEIKQLHNEGLGSRAIATQLRRKGISVSCKTIQRVLSGERVTVYS